VYEGASFDYEVDKNLMAQDGTCIIFSVFDHDLISANDFEGEAVIPLNILEGVAPKKWVVW